MASRALFEDDSLLEIMNFVQVRNREFVGFMNTAHNVMADRREAKVVEVDIKRPRPGKPVQMFWKPARGLVTEKIKDCRYLIQDLPLLYAKTIHLTALFS